MLQIHWNLLQIISNKQAKDMADLFNRLKPEVGAFDTETTGLHIKNDKPFLFQFGFVDNDFKEGYAYAVDIERQPHLSNQVIKYWNKYLAPNLKLYLAHNVKFDLHMLQNNGTGYMNDNLSDTLFYIRYAHDARTVKNGGPPLELKKYAQQFIDPSARTHETLLDREKTSIASQLNLMLRQRLHKAFPNDKQIMNKVKTYFKDPLMTYTTLPKLYKSVFQEWVTQDVPLYLQSKVRTLVESSMIPYNKLNRENVVHYALYDIVWVIEIYLKTKDILKNRGNELGVEIENKLIEPLMAMENTGFKVDVQYLLDSEARLRNYIIEQRQKLYKIAGQEFAIGQHALIKSLFKTKFNIDLPSTSKENLELTHSKLIRNKENPEAIEFIALLEELRTLEKWYAVYVLRFIRDLKNTDRLYTTINQVGTVSGRVTSDFQQFPKGGIVTRDGKELFKPRRMVLQSGGDYEGIVYLDYSQIELRFQALYTILVGHPDTNLCRAYMPYKCHDKDGKPFDYKNPECIRTWSKPWYLDEDPTKLWIATDVHGATTKAAFDIDESDPQFHDLRYVGKRVNFAKNYGAQYKKICEMFPDRTPEECRRIDAAYYTAFPGVKEYHTYCYRRAAEYGMTANLFNIKYYGVPGHNLINMLVQGSAAFYLKLKIIKLYHYMKEHNVKSRLQMQIHDELSWEKAKGEDEVFFEFKHIMEDWEDGYVPLVADMEITTSTWAEKVEVATLQELKEALRCPDSK